MERGNDPEDDDADQGIDPEPDVLEEDVSPGPDLPVIFKGEAIEIKGPVTW